METPARSRDDEIRIPRGLAVSAAISWRVVVVAVAILTVALLLSELRVAFLAVFLAGFATALLRPPFERLRDAGLPPSAAAAGVLGTAVAAAALLVYALLPTFVAQLEDLGEQVASGEGDIRAWLEEGPLAMSDADIDDAIDDALGAVRENSDTILSGALSGAQIAFDVVLVLLLALVLTFFFVRDGDRIRRWFIGLFGPRRREAVTEIASRSWTTPSGYLRGMAVVAAFDSVFIGVALVVLSVPAALPLAVLVFFGAFIPVAGAVITGLLAVLVALVAEGPVTALLVLGAVLVVQQIEGNLLQPVVVGNAVRVHPAGILLAVTCGGLIAGILGAFVAVPVAAVAVRIAGYLREQSEPEELPVGSA